MFTKLCRYLAKRKLRRQIKRKIAPLNSLSKSDLSHMNLDGFDLCGIKLAESNLARIKLAGANLQGANLANSNMSNSVLTNANLTYVDFTCANLRGVNMHGATLRSANLSGADLSYANLSGVRVDEKTNFTGANLTNTIIFEERIRNIAIIEGAIIKAPRYYDRWVYWLGFRPTSGDKKFARVVPI